MPNTSKTTGNRSRGGSKAQQVEAGKQSHKTAASKTTTGASKK